MGFTLLSESVENTDDFGALIGEFAEPGLIVTLTGDLGAGKTHLTKGIARGLGVPNPRYVSSPTFTIHKVYKGRLELNHLDFYRLDEGADPMELGLEEILGQGGICVIEWPDDFFSHLGDDLLKISIEARGETKRELVVEWSGPIAEKVGVRLLSTSQF